MKLSIQSCCLPAQSPADAARLAAAAGFAAIEWTAPPASCEALVAAAKDTGIESSGLRLASLPGAGLAERDKELHASAMGMVRAGLLSASKIGTSSLIVCPATLSGGVDYQSAYWAVQEGMMKLRFDAQRVAVRIVLDLTGSGLAGSPMEMRTLLDQISSAWVAASLDIERVSAIGSPRDWIGLLGRRLTHFYANDKPANWTGVASAIADCCCEGHIVCRDATDATRARQRLTENLR